MGGGKVPVTWADAVHDAMRRSVFTLSRRNSTAMPDVRDGAGPVSPAVIVTVRSLVSHGGQLAMATVRCRQLLPAA